MVRQAEGEKHSSIDKRRLPRERRREFDGLFRAIRDAIKDLATKDESESYNPEGFMELEVSGEPLRKTADRPRSKPLPSPKPPPAFTQIEEEQEPVPAGPEENRGSRTKKRKQKELSRGTGRRIPVSAVAIRNGETVRIAIQSSEDINGASIRLFQDCGSDASCTNPLADLPLKFKRVGCTGPHREELKIGELKEGQRSALIDVAFQSPPLASTVLKVDVISRLARPTEGAG